MDNLPQIEEQDRVRIRFPSDMGCGTVTTINGEHYWIQLDKEYQGVKKLRLVRRRRHEIIKLQGFNIK